MFWGAHKHYYIGSFDGKRFHKESPELTLGQTGNYYAAQTFNDIPPSDGRRIQISWVRPSEFFPLPGMPFNNFLSFPSELTLRDTPGGVRLHCEPVREIQLLHDAEHTWKDMDLEPEVENLLREISGDLFHITIDARPDGAVSIELSIRGVQVRYDFDKASLTVRETVISCESNSDDLFLEILVDRMSIETFVNHGQTLLPICVIPDQNNATLDLKALGGRLAVRSLEVFELTSAWPI